MTTIELLDSSAIGRLGEPVGKSRIGHQGCTDDDATDIERMTEASAFGFQSFMPFGSESPQPDGWSHRAQRFSAGSEVSQEAIREVVNPAMHAGFCGGVAGQHR